MVGDAHVSELERQGTKNRTLRGMERRTAQQGRDLSDRLDGLNPSTGTTFMGGTILEDIEISTTPTDFAHGLRAEDQGVNRSSRYVGRAARGAWIIKGHTGAFQLVVADAADPTRNISLACDSGGPFTVTVAVV